MTNQEILIEVARNFIKMGYYDVKVRDTLESKKVTAAAETHLLKYIAHCQKLSITTHRSDISIREMKKQLFNLIGYIDPNESRSSYYAYQATVSKSDLTAIYNFITALPTEYFSNTEMATD